MPNLDWGILAGQMLLRGIFEVPIASVFVVPAFIFAVANFSSRTNAIVFGGFAAILIGSLLLKNGSIVMIIVVVAAVSGIGLLYRSFYWLRRFGVLVALATAVAVGVVIFSVTPFGRNDCWP
jgi:hypothetical protein